MRKIIVFSVGVLAFAQPQAVLCSEILKAPPQVATAPLESLNCPLVRDCGDNGCIVRRVCRIPTCPPGYPCYSLYGAYGPYGGPQYWGAFTSTGWAYPKW